jgi:hypothetical protein
METQNKVKADLIKSIKEEQAIIKDALSLIDFAQSKISKLISDYELRYA